MQNRFIQRCFLIFILQFNLCNRPVSLFRTQYFLYSNSNCTDSLLWIKKKNIAFVELKFQSCTPIKQVNQGDAVALPLTLLNNYNLVVKAYAVIFAESTVQGNTPTQQDLTSSTSKVVNIHLNVYTIILFSLTILLSNNNRININQTIFSTLEKKHAK